MFKYGDLSDAQRLALHEEEEVKEWKLVPVEPTYNMYASAKGAGIFDPRVSGRAWDLMLAAAPQPPALGGEPEGLRAWLREKIGVDLDEKNFKGLETRDVYVATTLWEDHVAPLLAEIERLSALAEHNAQCFGEMMAERDTLKAERESLRCVEPNYEDVERLCRVLGYLGVSTPESGEESAARWLSLVRTLIRTAETSKLLRQDAEKIAEYMRLRALNAEISEDMRLVVAQMECVIDKDLLSDERLEDLEADICASVKKYWSRSKPEAAPAAKDGE